MAILIDKNTRLVIQGITGKEGSFHAHQMIEYGTNVVAGVSPGHGEEIFNGSIPVYNTMRKAVEETYPNTSVIFVPPRFAADAIIESVDARIPLIVCITEGVPNRDMLRVKDYMRNNSRSRLIGPNSPGMLSPGLSKVGIMPAFIGKRGNIGIVSRSGTLTYEAAAQIIQHGYGISSAVGIGGDPIIGTSHKEVVAMFESDDETDAIVMIGEIGGSAEEDAASFIAEHVTKPVVAYIAGISAPVGTRMGHAGAIISGGKGKAEDKIEALKNAGVIIAYSPADIGSKIKEVMYIL